jgi:hypothetical protein
MTKLNKEQFRTSLRTNNIMKNSVKHFKKLKIMAGILNTCGLFMAIFKF